ncbi:MAG: outer membrane protein assembly factor BamB [Kangiellaceae bacterium]
MRLISLLIVSLIFLVGCDDEIDIYEPNPLVEIENEFETKTVWSVSIGDGIGDRALHLNPVYAYDKIYVADHSGAVSAIEPSNGKEIWRKEFELDIAGGPAVGSKLVAIGTSQGEVLVLDADTGDEKWRAQVSSEIISSPAVGEGYVVARTVDGRIYAFDANDGTQKWFYDESLPALTLRGNSAPIIAGGGVIAGFANGKLSVFILANGQLAWEKKIATPIGSSEIQRLVDVDIQPLLVGSSIFIGSFNGNLASLEMRSGEVNWQRELSTFQDMAVGDLILYATHENSHFSALNRTNGVILWTQKDLYRRQLTAPAVYDKWAVVCDFEGYLHWINSADGKVVSREEIDSSGIAATPLVIDDNIILLSRDGTLTAVTQRK